MSELESEFEMGSPVECLDGSCGVLSNLVVDPVRRMLTHLVVGPRGSQLAARLVPVERARLDGGRVLLDCTLADWRALPHVAEVEFVPAASFGMYLPDSALAWPYYSLGDADAALTYEKLPPGEVEIRRGERVHASDGAIGHVKGLVVDPDDHHITHVLLQEGHLWASKEVAIPVSAVTAIDAEGVHIRLSKREAGELPPVAVARP